MFVRRRVFGARIGLVQNELRRIVGPLQHVEAAVAGLAHRACIIKPRCLDEILDVFGLDLHPDDGYVHGAVSGP